MVAVIGLLATGAAAALVHAHEWDNARSLIDRTTLSARAAVQFELQRYTDALKTVAGGLGGQDPVTPAGFDAATAPLAGLDLRGVTAVALMVPATSDRVAQTQATWRDRGVTGLTLKPEGTGEHFFAVLQRALDGSPRTVGADISPVPEPTAALLRARTSGGTTVSDPYVLIRDRGRPDEAQKRSVVFATPVTDAAGRFQAWVVIGVRAADLLNRLLPAGAKGWFQVDVHAGSGALPIARVTGSDKGRPELTAVADLVIADQQWTMRVAADRSALPGTDTPLDTGIAAGGVALTGLLTALVYVLATVRRRLESEVYTATAEARAAEREARRQAGLLGAVMDSIGDGVAVMDGDGRFILSNPAARSLVGSPVESADPDDWANRYGLFKADGVSAFAIAEMPIIRALHGEWVTDEEMIARNPGRPDGARLNVSARPLDPAAGQPGAVAVFHDVTDRRAAEDAVRRLNAELEDRVDRRTAQLAARAEQLRAANAELEAFSYSVSHDLRAPLRAVDGFARMLELDYATFLDDTGRRYVARVRAGAQTMGELIDGLLAFSRLQRQELSHEEVRLDRLVDEVWDELAPDRVGRRVELVVGDLPPAAGDRRLIRQVVANLLHNALKYTRSRAETRIEVGFTDDAYFVKDNGAGFDSQYVDRLFQVFQRLHRAEDYEGTGVGLALASRIVLRHGGRIWAEGETDRGATFHFTLPKLSHERKGATDVVSADAGAAGGGQPVRPGVGAARV
ncbi:ATP-binding protein [Virgisporangium aurantiacum]|uniref:ATP-binding protein n=1 Tax=Virgisporangium aurantiacum TaxID=175570 RepID=UPI00194ED95A|nr:ATP-binding protein [Virgisporangium aurantiacum]